LKVIVGFILKSSSPAEHLFKMAPGLELPPRDILRECLMTGLNGLKIPML
jgi:hypothetical protein